MNLKGKSFLKLLDFTPEEINGLIDLAFELKSKKKSGIPHKLCEGKNVEIVEFPFIGFEDIVRSGRIDCTVFRGVGWNTDAEKLGLGAVPLSAFEGFSAEETNTPVVLVRKVDYGTGRLLQKYFNGQEISRIQQEVLDGRRTMKFY